MLKIKTITDLGLKIQSIPKQLQELGINFVIARNGTNCNNEF